MRTGTVAFLSGIILFLQCREIPDQYWLLLFPISLLIAFYFPRSRIICVFLCGFFWAMIRAEIILSSHLDTEIEGNTITVIGQVVSLPELRGRSTRFEFDITHVESNQWPSPGKVRLRWYEKSIKIKPGQYWQLKIRLKRPYGFMNLGGFDYEAWLFSNRIRATGYVVNSSNENFIIGKSGYIVHRIRYQLREIVTNLLGEHTFQGLVFGLGIGDRSQLSQDQKISLQKTGTNHLLAISGLHIGIIAGLIYFLSFRIYSLFDILPIYLAAPRFAAVTAMIAAVFYAALAGFSIPTQRALIMLSVFMFFIIKKEKISFSYVITFALLAILLFDPFATMTISFWLSFGAILTIAYGMLCRVEIENLWWQWGRAQYLVGLGIMPLTLLFFQQYAMIGFLANLIAIPWVSIFILPFVLAGIFLSYLTPDIGLYLLLIACQALELLFLFFSWIENFDFNLIQITNINIGILMASFVGIFILLLPNGIPARWIGLFWLLPLFFPYKNRPDNNEFYFTLLDVGQGLSAIIQTNKHLLIYDTGPKFSASFNAGDSVLLPYLHKKAINNVDMLIVSHGDNDHIGGAKYVLKEFPAKTVLTSVPDQIEEHPVTPCYSGQAWSWDGVLFEILHPDEHSKTRGNDNSCVLKVSNRHKSILLSGDIESKGEKKLLSRYGEKLQATVLIVPHHGSKTSSTPEFIDAVKPEYAFFPIGYRNRYKFPNQDIIRRYETRGIKLLNTAQYGAITLETHGPDMTISSYRQTVRRFWHTSFY